MRISFKGLTVRIPSTITRPGRFWFFGALALALPVGLLDAGLIWPFIFQMHLVYFIFVRPVLVFLGYLEPLRLCKKIRRRKA